ncbi:head-tail connector protein [Cellulophaga phage phi18:2]|uniref:Head-tail connector protein n=2 Tax=Cellulophaga phage phi18:1 TaxID=1327982 RepID=S0A1D8_9CAUD|nr:head-tail adaptor Ad1 [Cellulophaga phage phi18:1]AGO48497.1 head-tail connector protein [Cellulophaga phage phi18:1]AGO49211.1 head-tail connector protein [Cellulophaga phage phi18:2]
MDYSKNADKWEDCSSPQTISGTTYEVVTDLATEPVDLEFFKEHARIDFDTDDTLAQKYLKAARIQLEQWSMLSFGVKTIEFSALEVCDNYKIMFGPVDEITTAGFSNFKDNLTKGGKKVVFEYTTKNTLSLDENVQIAICRYAAGLYMNRENVIDSKLSSTALIDQAKLMLEPYRNIIIF